MTRDGIERTDILAVMTKNEGRRLVEIQVKTARGPKFEYISWPLGPKAQDPISAEHEFFVLVAIPEISPLKATFGNLSDHPLYEAIALETATPLIRDVFSDVLSDKKLKSDQIHANAKGYVVLAEEIGRELAEMGFAKLVFSTI